MPLRQVTDSLYAAFIEALIAADPQGAEHLASALLRNLRPQLIDLVCRCDQQQRETVAVIRDGSYRRREYRITAIVSTYRAERFLQGRLTDLLNQSIADHVEIIVIDSNSPEHESDIVANFQRHADNIRYLRTNRRESVYQAWNRGGGLATGQFITNANCDDRLRHDALERLTDTLLQTPSAGFAYGDFRLTRHENETFEHNHAYERTQRPAYSLNNLLENCITGSQPVWRKTLHTTVGIFDTAYNSAADYDFFIRAAQQMDGVAIHEPLGLVLTSPTTFSGVGQLPTLEFYAIRERYQHLLKPTGNRLPLSQQESTILAQLGNAQTSAYSLPDHHSPVFAHELGQFYQRQHNTPMAWRYLQRAFYLLPENPEYRASLETCLIRNLLDSMRDLASSLQQTTTRDLVLSTALVANLLGCRASAAWLYTLALTQHPDDIVSLANLKNMLPTLPGGR